MSSYSRTCGQKRYRRLRRQLEAESQKLEDIVWDGLLDAVARLDCFTALRKIDKGAKTAHAASSFALRPKGAPRETE